MKRFFISALAVAIFFVGLGALVDKTGAKFKSDDKALALVAKARQALGGDAAIKRVQSLRIVGSTSKKINADGEARTITGDTEIALQFPDKFMRNTNFGEAAKGDGTRVVTNERHVMVTSDQPGDVMIRHGEGHGTGAGVGIGTEGNFSVVLKKPDGTTEQLSGEDAKKWIAAHRDGNDGGQQIVLKKMEGGIAERVKIGDATPDGVVVRKMKTTDGEPLRSADGENVFIRHGGGNTAFAFIHQNDFFRTALGLLMTTPEGEDVSYTSAGRADLDGTGCSVVIATVGGDSYKLFLDENSNLPVGMSFRGEAAPQVMTFTVKGDGNGDGVFTSKVPAPPGGDKDVVVVDRKAGDGTEAGPNLMYKRALPTVEYTVRFSDYRDVNGVQLPFRWTQTGGDSEEVFTITNYEVNPANISQRFEQQPGVMKLRRADH